MRDEIFDREYQQGRDALNDGIDRGVRAIGRFLSVTFDAIHRVQFDAPWQRGAPAKRIKPAKRARAA